MMHWSHDGMQGYAAMMGGGGGLLGGLLVLVVLALAVVGVVTLLQGRQGASSGVATARVGSRAQQILDERFARGELDVEEYVRQRETLRSP